MAVPKVPGSKAVEAPAEEGPEKLAGQGEGYLKVLAGVGLGHYCPYQNHQNASTNDICWYLSYQ